MQQAEQRKSSREQREERESGGGSRRLEREWSLLLDLLAAEGTTGALVPTMVFVLLLGDTCAAACIRPRPRHAPLPVDRGSYRLYLLPVASHRLCVCVAQACATA
jgi:hypothetical protein